MEHQDEMREAWRIQVSESFAEQLRSSVAVAENDETANSKQPTTTANSNSQQQQRLTERGTIEIKGKGLMKTFWLEGPNQPPT